MQRPLIVTSWTVLVLLTMGSCETAADIPRRGSESPSSSAPTPGTYGALVSTACSLPKRWVRAVYRGSRPGEARDHDILIVPDPPNYAGSFTYTSHSGPYDFLQKVPLTFYGPSFVKDQGRISIDREVTVADLAPTYARVLGMPWARTGARSIDEILAPTTRTPRLIVTVSIDGGGWNVLDEWPDATPFLRGLMDRGTNVDGAVVGSSPSVTPAIHTNIGTGTFPREHGVTGIVVRADDGSMTGSFSAIGKDAPLQPDISLRVTTVADEWDLMTGNEAKVGLMASGKFILGMLSQGTAVPGGDKDMVALLESRDEWFTEPRYYSLPGYLNPAPVSSSVFLDEVDRADGSADGLWLGHELATLPFGNTPALAPWQVDVATDFLDRENYGQDDVADLFHLHFKSPDHAGHMWNMINPEQRDVLMSVDRALQDLVAWLEEHVGDEQFMLVVTADHGQTPVEAGGWPINRYELERDIGDAFDHNENERQLIEHPSPTVLHTDVDEMGANGTTAKAISAFLMRYTIGENINDGNPIPGGFEDRIGDRIFRAVLPAGLIDDAARCAGVEGA